VVTKLFVGVLQPISGDKMVEVSDVGRMIKCPECGEMGKVGIEKVSVKGKIYLRMVRIRLVLPESHVDSCSF